MSSQPNILLIMNDDMGFSDISCYGGEVQTPNLDRLAAGGVRMSRFSNTARCCPTRASLLTGLHPHQAGVGWMAGPDDGEDAYRGNLNPNTVTLAEVLRSAGYKTYMSGKWHVSSNRDNSKKSWPCQRGFEHYWGLIDGCANYFYPHRLVKQNEDVTAEHRHADFYLTDAIADHAADYIREHCSTHPETPFFLYTAFTAPHWPLHAKEADIAKYHGRFQAGWDQLRKERMERIAQMGLVDENWELSKRDEAVPSWEDAPDQEWELRRMETYAAQIDCMDQGIGRILHVLEENGQLENTLIMFLADNGACAEVLDDAPRRPGVLPDNRTVRCGNTSDIHPGPADTYQSYGVGWANLSNTPFREYKHWVHEGGISTPFIAHWPEQLTNPGAIVKQPGQLPDIMATCLDVSGAHYPLQKGDTQIPACEGFSLTPIWRDDTANGRQFLVWEHEGNKAITMGRYKAVCKHLEHWELFDLENDRTETKDLSRKGGNLRETFLQMIDIWNQWADRVGVVPYETILARRNRNR